MMINFENANKKIEICEWYLPDRLATAIQRVLPVWLVFWWLLVLYQDSKLLAWCVWELWTHTSVLHYKTGRDIPIQQLSHPGSWPLASAPLKELSVVCLLLHTFVIALLFVFVIQIVRTSKLSSMVSSPDMLSWDTDDCNGGKKHACSPEGLVFGMINAAYLHCLFFNVKIHPSIDSNSNSWGKDSLMANFQYRACLIFLLMLLLWKYLTWPASVHSLMCAVAHTIANLLNLKIWLSQLVESEKRC